MSRMVKTFSLALGASVLLATTVNADGFQRIEDEVKFLNAIEDRSLKRFGIRLQVSGDGQILGRAFGQKVSGDWDWKDGFFCRDLYLGGRELDADNCQMVEIRGNTVRFTSDMGQGDYADLRIE